MKVLGITHPSSLNSAACLIVNGNIVALAEEERFTRIKHSPYQPAAKSLSYCLQEGGFELEDVDYIAIGSDNYFKIISSNLLSKLQSLIKSLSGPRPFTNPEKALRLSGSASPYLFTKPLLDCYLGLMRLPFNYQDKRVRFVRHHLAHIASAYYVSGFTKACIISVDGGGGQEAGMLAVGNKEKIEVLKTISIKDSLGFLYTTVTEILGFERFDGEGKVMGLSSYADKNVDLLPFVSFKNGITVIDQSKMNRYLSLASKKLSKDPLAKPNRNLAGSLQKTLEQSYIYMADYLYKATGISSFCLTGGVSLNCLANSQILSQDFVDNIFIQPASNDAGTALGAALQVYVETTGKFPQAPFKHCYMGPEFNEEQILTAIKKSEIACYKKERSIEKVAARLLAAGKIIGWFQGRMEVGPRALGNRSILANPSLPQMKDEVNLRVKGREPWRPFAPSILEEYAQQYLVDTSFSPFMILSSRVWDNKKKDIIATIHVDGTVRPQTVSKNINPRYWNLINEFRKLTGIPAVLNTSFNLAGEPIVCSPMDAISSYFRTGLDYLIIGDYLISKTPQINL